MTFKEFRKWANERACDGQWGLTQAIETAEIYDNMRKAKLFKKRYWKNNCEERAIKLVESVNQITEQVKEKYDDN